MGIKETPTSNKTSYKSMQAKTTERVELAKEKRENLEIKRDHKSS